MFVARRRSTKPDRQSNTFALQSEGRPAGHAQATLLAGRGFRSAAATIEIGSASTDTMSLAPLAPGMG